MEAIDFAVSQKISLHQAVGISANFRFASLKFVYSPGNREHPPTGVHHALACAGLWDLTLKK